MLRHVQYKGTKQKNCVEQKNIARRNSDLYLKTDVMLPPHIFGDIKTFRHGQYKGTIKIIQGQSKSPKPKLVTHS